MGLKSINRFDNGKTNNRNKPDVVVMDKKEGKCLITDIARPFDTRISEKTLKKYLDLKRELRRIWNKEALGALWMVSTSLRKWVQVLDVAKELELLQMLCLLGTAKLRTQTYFRSSLLSTHFGEEKRRPEIRLWSQAREQQGSLEKYWTWDKSHQQKDFVIHSFFYIRIYFIRISRLKLAKF